MRYRLTRMNTKTGATYSYDGLLTKRELGQTVAYCANDNVGWDRKASAEAGKRAEEDLANGDVVEIGDYEFRAEELAA